MRRMAWMLILVWMIGCGSSSTPTKSVSSTDDPVIPAEVASLFERGEVTNAIETLTGMIAKSPRDVSLYALRATGYHRVGEYDKAMADLDYAISIADRDPKLYNNRGFIRLGLQKFDDALNDFDKATQLAPKYMNPYNNRGLLYLAQQKYLDAITEFNRALEIDDRYVDAYNNRGFAEFEAGKLAQALDDFNIAIQLNSDYVNAYNNRGLLRARAGDYDNAIVDFTHAMMLDPLNPKYYEHRCEVYQRQGALDKAIADEKKYDWLVEYHDLTADIAKNASPANELIQRAKHFMQVEHDDKALTDLDRAIQLNPKSAEGFAVRASVHLRQKSMDNAKADAEASLAIAPNQEAYSVMGDMYLSRRDYDRAIENFANARRVDPNVAEAYYAKSKALAKQGQTEQAQVNLEQALALDPDVESRLR